MAIALKKHNPMAPLTARQAREIAKRITARYNVPTTVTRENQGASVHFRLGPPESSVGYVLWLAAHGASWTGYPYKEG